MKLIKKIKNLLIRLGYYSQPDFMIIGAQKAGTTSLYGILKQHSQILGSSKKEITYFNNEDWYSKKTLYQYHSYFPIPFQIKKGVKLFEATPSYLSTQGVAQKLYEYNPQLKFIILLREPASRALSGWTLYHHHCKEGYYKHLYEERSFSDRIQDEIHEIENNIATNDRRECVKRGLYFNQISEYLQYFPMEQLLIIESKELKDDFDSTMKKIQEFIGVEYEKLEEKVVNQSKVNIREQYQEELGTLKQFYKPYNEKLFELINRKFSW